MKHQEVSVDYWAMLKAMLTYGVLTLLCWVMMRMFNTVFTLPRRMKAQQERIQDTLQELQRRFPDLNITEEDLKNAEKDLEDLINNKDKELKDDETNKNTEESPKEIEEDKKTI